MKGSLVLEDGTIVQGEAFGEPRTAYGELVFNTNMTGYCEALTDPSYRGQILMMTYPLIGNYGVDPETFESHAIQPRAFVVREACPTPSHSRSQYGVEDLLRRHRIPGLQGVDTRRLTTKTRAHGTMRAAVAVEGDDPETVLKEVKRMPFPDKKNLVGEVSTTKEVFYNRPGDARFVVLDCGVKMNIIRQLGQFGDVIQVPFDMHSDEILAHQPNGVVISNGPGDPAHPDLLRTAVRTAAELTGLVPMLGICLGHQILGLALGGKTFKLKFGHRGGNQPVKDLETGRVHITSQNHGFALDAKSLEGKDVVVSHVNLNDGTVEGFRHKDLPIVSVQYHPEAAPGPHDNQYLFAAFAKLAGR